MNKENKHVKLLINIYAINDGWIFVSMLRGTMFGSRDVNVKIYIQNILFCESVSFDSGIEVEYLGMENEWQFEESRAYHKGYSKLEELIQNKETYCIITIPENYYLGLEPLEHLY